MPPKKAAPSETKPLKSDKKGPAEEENKDQEEEVSEPTCWEQFTSCIINFFKVKMKTIT
jgi:hypothetical protein